MVDVLYRQVTGIQLPREGLLAQRLDSGKRRWMLSAPNVAKFSGTRRLSLVEPRSPEQASTHSAGCLPSGNTVVRSRPTGVGQALPLIFNTR